MVPAQVAQLVEHFLGKEEVTGSTPVVGLRHRSVAQLAEQRSPKPQVAGSSPVAPAKGVGPTTMQAVTA